MNVLIVDTEKIRLDEANKIFRDCLDKSGDDSWVVIPKDISIMMDASIDWMKMIRDTLDEEIRMLESDVNGKNIDRKG